MATRRAVTALHLRLRAYSYSEIGTRLGVCPQRAYQLVSAAIADLTSPLHEPETPEGQYLVDRIKTSPALTFHKKSIALDFGND